MEAALFQLDALGKQIVELLIHDRDLVARFRDFLQTNARHTASRTWHPQKRQYLENAMCMGNFTIENSKTESEHAKLVQETEEEAESLGVFEL